MKNLLLLPLIAFFASCSTEVDLTADWKEIPVVVGLLDPGEPAQYIKITKAYLDPEKDARAIAQISDSLYFDTLVVTLEELSSGNTATLQRIDGNKEGLEKEEGTFANTPNWLYKTTFPVKTGKGYRLTIENPRSGHIATAETIVVSETSLADPWCYKGMWSEGRKPPTSDVEWTSGAELGEIFEGVLRFYYEEKNAAGVTSKKFIDWTIFKNVTQKSCQSRYCITLALTSFLSKISSQISADPAVTRYPGCIEIRIWAGGEALKDFINTKTAQSNSIVQTQAVTEFANIENGRGLFSSRYQTIYPNFQLSSLALDSIANHPLTTNRNFQNVSQRCDICD